MSWLKMRDENEPQKFNRPIKRCTRSPPMNNDDTPQSLVPHFPIHAKVQKDDFQRDPKWAAAEKEQTKLLSTETRSRFCPTRVTAKTSPYSIRCSNPTKNVS